MKQQFWDSTLLRRLISYLSHRLRRWQLMVLASVISFSIVLLNTTVIAQIDVLNTKPEVKTTNTSVYHFKVGEFNAMVVSDGTLSFPTKFFVPKADPKEVAKVLTEHFLSTEDVFAHVNALYVETDEHKVLIDSGAGNAFGPTAGHLLRNLEEAGITVPEIDTVILTHAHPDHIGGILDAEGQVRLPNAQFYISQAESDFWMADPVEMPKSLLDEETKTSLIATAKSNLSSIKDRTTLFAMGDEVIPHIQAVDSAGHTPGQASFLISSGDESLLSTGDVFFSDPLNL